MADNKENKVLNVPALRFPGFKNSWDCTILEKLSKKIGDGIHSTPSYDDDGTFYFINGNNLNRGKIVITSSTKRVSEKEAYKNNAENLEADSILMSINGTIGNVALYNNEPIMLGKSACYINSKDNVDKKFLFYYLQYPKTQSYFEAELTGTTIKNLSLQSIRKTKICIPTIEEQHKISHFLQKIDERIATQNKIIEDWKKLKSAIVEELYSATKGETYSFRQLLEVVNEKNRKLEYTNVLSASQELGMIKRSDINIDIKFEQDSICGYKIVRNGDYVVHLRSFQGGFAFSDKTGICSPAYTILRPNDLVVYGYLSHFFTSRLFIKSLKLVTYGIRDGRSINVDELLNMTVILPTIQEQLHIIEIINSISSKLYNETRIYDSLLRQKSYLLKAMFI